MVKPFDIVVAADLKDGIGKDQTLPWKLSGDMAYFKELTCSVTSPGMSNAVIMGRKTWESIPPKFRPLSGRLNIVLTRDAGFELPAGVLKAGDFEEALSFCQTPHVENIFVIGGGAIFAQSMHHAALNRLYLTDVHAVYPCDTFLPPYKEDFELVSSSPIRCENGVEYCFKIYRKL